MLIFFENRDKVKEWECGEENTVARGKWRSSWVKGWDNIRV